MSKTLDPMDLKQIINLKLDGLSNRSISKTLGLGRNTVNRYVSLFNSSDLDLKELLTLDEKSLRELFPIKTTIDNNRYDTLMGYLKTAHSQESHPGFTLLNHYNEYVGNCKNPYSYTQFITHYNRKYQKIKGSMKLDHKAGHEVFVDYAGKKIDIIDRETGEIKKAEIFVAILPCSHYTYVEVSKSQKRADFLKSLAGALSFFGGVPKAIVSDNLKSAVSKASKYEAEINRSLKDFSFHYHCVINPTRTFSPQDKALVESAVKLFYQRIFYPLRAMQFFSIEQANEQIFKKLSGYNDLLFQCKEGSRKELFQAMDRDFLKPLPPAPYQIKSYCRAKVQKMGYVHFSPDKSYYSVPFRYIGKDTQIQYTDDFVEVYLLWDRIAIHQRNPTRGAYITNKDHLSSTHRAYSDWSPSYFQKASEKYGNHTTAFMKGMFSEGDYPEIHYKRAIGILSLAKAHGGDRLNQACGIACYLEKFSYRLVKNILENRQDMLCLDLESLDQSTSHIPKHENIRGATHYQ